MLQHILPWQTRIGRHMLRAGHARAHAMLRHAGPQSCHPLRPRLPATQQSAAWRATGATPHCVARHPDSLGILVRVPPRRAFAAASAGRARLRWRTAAGQRRLQGCVPASAAAVSSRWAAAVGALRGSARAPSTFVGVVRMRCTSPCNGGALGARAVLADGHGGGRCMAAGTWAPRVGAWRCAPGM